MSEPTLYDEKLVKARKSHKCSGCGAAIAKGEQYNRIKGLWDGEFESYKHCVNCKNLMGWIQDARLHTDYTLENLRYFLNDTRDYDETAADIADRLRLPVAYVAEVIK